MITLLMRCCRENAEVNNARYMPNNTSPGWPFNTKAKCIRRVVGFTLVFAADDIACCHCHFIADATPPLMLMPLPLIFAADFRFSPYCFRRHQPLTHLLMFIRLRFAFAITLPC